MIGFVGDLHAGSPPRHGGPLVNGINTRGRMILDVLSRAIAECEARRCTDIVFAGDLIDDMRPRPQLLAELRERLAQGRSRKWVLRGNHDSASDAEGDNAVRVLHDPEGGVFAVETPTVVGAGDVDLLLVPFRSGQVSGWLPSIVEALGPLRGEGRPTALCLHAGIRDSETAPWLQSATDAIHVTALTRVMMDAQIGYTFAGNWHDHRRWDGPGIHQLGAICPTGWSNLGVTEYGNVALLKDWKVSYCYVPGPRFLKFEGGASPAVLKPDENAYFVEWTVPPEEYDEAQRELVALKAAGVLYDGSVLPDTSHVLSSLSEGTRSVGRQASIKEALAVCIERVEAPGVDLQAVLKRCFRYLGV